MTSKSLNYYLDLPYKFEVFPEDDGSGFTAVIPDLPGCITSADTVEELIPMLMKAKEFWIENALQGGDFILEPSPVEEEAYSGKFVARLPRSLHRQLATWASSEVTSLNQLVVAILAEEMSRWAGHEESAHSYFRH